MQELQDTGREQRSLDEFRRGFDAFRNQTQCQQAADQPQESYVPSQPAPARAARADCGRVQKTSDSPQVYAYKRQTALRDAGGKFGATAKASLSRVLKQEIPHQPGAVKSGYIDANKPYFAPTKEFIYVPQAKNGRQTVNAQAAQIGQTAYFPICGESARTLWRDRWNETQHQNDFCAQKRATCGYENLANQYVVDGGFAPDCATGRLQGADACNMTNNANICRIQADCTSQTRAQLAENNKAAFEIAQSDRDRAHARWLADKNKPNPIGVDMVEKSVSLNQAIEAQMKRDKTLEERRERQRLLGKAEKAAVALYGDNEKVREWVAGLTANRVKQLADVAERGMRDGVIADECRRRIDPWFYMYK